MFGLLIAIIYLAFISLGLPDSLLGSAWPVMHAEIGASVSWAGIITIIISLCTIISALFTNKLVCKIGTSVVTALSVFITAAAMLAFSFSTAFWQLCLFAIPYGLGAGAIDTALNDFVAKRLSSRHMSWLHCCWGIGATVGPYVMGYCLTGAHSWHGGYFIISMVQFFLTLVMFLSIPLWKKQLKYPEAENEKQASLPLKETFKLKGAVFAFLAGLFYFAIEQLPIVWASTYFHGVYLLNAETSAFLASLFYIGITVSRAVCGFFTDKIGDKLMIRGGLSVVLIAAILIAVAIPVRSYIPAVVGFTLVGLGCGPVYPSLIHSAPKNFGEENSGSVIGVQMAFSYCGMTFTPILFGKIAELTTIKLLPFGIILFAALVLIFTELTNFKTRKNQINA